MRVGEFIRLRSGATSSLEFLRVNPRSVYNPWRFRVELCGQLDFKCGGYSMAELGDEKVSGKFLAFFLVAGSLGAIVMTWIAYAAMVGRAI